jgi:hypothetical protein
LLLSSICTEAADALATGIGTNAQPAKGTVAALKDASHRDAEPRLLH